MAAIAFLAPVFSHTFLLIFFTVDSQLCMISAISCTELPVEVRCSTVISLSEREKLSVFVH